MAGVCSGPGPCDVTSFGSGDNWVTKVAGLPLYIRAVAHALRRSGHSEADAIATAVATVKRWAAGGGGVTAATRARAVKALAEWEAKKTEAHALSGSDAGSIVDLASVHQWKHGWIPLTPEALAIKLHKAHGSATPSEHGAAAKAGKAAYDKAMASSSRVADHLALAQAHEHLAGALARRGNYTRAAEHLGAAHGLKKAAVDKQATRVEALRTLRQSEGRPRHTMSTSGKEHAVRKAGDLQPGDVVKTTGARVTAVEAHPQGVKVTYHNGATGVLSRESRVGVYRAPSAERMAKAQLSEGYLKGRGATEADKATLAARFEQMHGRAPTEAELGKVRTAKPPKLRALPTPVDRTRDELRMEAQSPAIARANRRRKGTNLSGGHMDAIDLAGASPPLAERLFPDKASLGKAKARMAKLPPALRPHFRSMVVARAKALGVSVDLAAPAHRARLRTLVAVRARELGALELASTPANLRADARREAAKAGKAMPDGSYPTTTRDLFDKAVKAVERGGASHNAIRRYLIKRAKAEGWPIPDTWQADGSLKADMSRTVELAGVTAVTSAGDGPDFTYRPVGTEAMDVSRRLRAIDALRARGHSAQAKGIEEALVKEKTNRARRMADGSFRAHTEAEVRAGLEALRSGRASSGAAGVRGDRP